MERVEATNQMLEETKKSINAMDQKFEDFNLEFEKMLEGCIEGFASGGRGMAAKNVPDPISEL